MSDHAFGRIFHRNHSVVRAVLGHLRENVRDGLLRRVTQARTESLHGGLVRKSRLRPEVGDGHRFLQRQRAGHDFAVNGAQRIILDRPVVEFADALQHDALAVRRVDGLAGLKLDFANLQNVLRALVEQMDDLRVELVDGLAMIGNGHGVEFMLNRRKRSERKRKEIANDKFSMANLQLTAAMYEPV